MSIITLTTDFGLKDHYAASLKGALLRQMPSALLIDITHQIPLMNYAEAGYVLGNAFHEFPAGTIHLVAVGSGGSGPHNHVAMKFRGHYFVGCDNGTFALIDPNTEPELIVQLALSGKEPSTFLARDLYLPAALKLASGTPLEKLGLPQSRLTQLMFPVSPPETDVLKGIVVYVDSFRNLITNISGDAFDEVGKGRLFSIELIRLRGKETITELHRTYGDVPIGGIVAFFNSTGMLEIAINNGPAAELLNLRQNSVVRITFE
ncbi:SAM-dependent chlorinase/fluorinase [soil metagenome]